jgi:hypothetical protein
VLVAAALLAIPAPSFAATFGSNLDDPPQFQTIPDFAFVQRTLAADNQAAGGTTAPFEGIVTAFRVRTSGSVAFNIRFRLFRGNTSVARSLVHQVPAVAGVHEFAAQFPVQAGDAVGLENPGPTQSAHITTVGGTNDHWSPPPFADETRAPNGSSSNQLLVNAEVEPDCDGDELGDETQDPSPIGGSCAPRDRGLVLEVSRSKVRAGKSVTLRGQLTELVRQGECQAGQAIELQRKKPKQTEFTTFDQVPTFASGTFSAKVKVKKTFEYRAQVAENATCAGQTSNTEKVKVKKPK